MSTDFRNVNGRWARYVSIALCISFLLNCSSVLAQTHVFGGSRFKQSRIREEDRDPSKERIGQLAAEFSDCLVWENSKPLSLAKFKGTPILLHFWIGNCDFCKESIETVKLLQEKYGPKGLVIIAIRAQQADDDSVKRWTVSFPVAQDKHWCTVRRYWNDGTSSYMPGTFLIDKNGVIQWACLQRTLGLPKTAGARDFASLSSAIDVALAAEVQNAVVSRSTKLSACNQPRSKKADTVARNNAKQ